MHSILGLHNISTVSFTFNVIEDNAGLIDNSLNFIIKLGNNEICMKDLKEFTLNSYKRLQFISRNNFN